MNLRPEPGQLRLMHLRVGLLAAAGLAILAIASRRLDAAGSLVSNPVEFAARPADGLGLREGSQVTVAGLPAGLISTLAVDSFAELDFQFAAADTALRAVTAVSIDLRFVASKLRDGEGTVGNLFTDRALYDTLLQTVHRSASTRSCAA